jgi:tetratricopeptide (TPR) repeat protein
MRDDHAYGGRLERPRRLRPPLIGRPAPGWLGWIVAGVLGLALIDRPSELDCVLATRTRTPGAAVSICEREYRDTRNPVVGVRLADLWRQAGQREAARALATRLLDTPERASALQIVGKIAGDEHRLDEAVGALAAARDLHRTAHDAAGLARDDQALANIEVKRHRFGDALTALDECLQQASAAGDTYIEYFCRLAATKVLAEVGDLAVAQRELDRAAELARSDRDRVWLEYERGNLDQEYVRAPQGIERALRSIAAFERAARLNARAQVPGFQLTLEHNLALSLVDAGRLDDAERHLAVAALVDADDEGAGQRTEIAAEIAFRRGDLARAAQLSEQRHDAADDDEVRIRAAALRARIALAGDDLPTSERWARRGIAAVERIRAAQAAPELRSYVLATRRTPYELLFVALARAGRLDDAVVALDQWQGRTLLDALARPSPQVAPGLLGAAQRVAELGALLPVVSEVPLGVAADPRQLLAALRTADLLALVVAGRDVWRVTASQGRLDIADLGSFAGLQDALDRFAGAPTEPALASELGAQLVPAAAVRTTPAPLHVLLDGPLASLPVVALRRDGRPLIAARPVVRVFRLPRSACRPARAPTRRTVIADAQSDLPDAGREAAELSSVLGFTAAVGAAATRAALFEAAGSDVLHIAVHAAVGAGGGVLELRDHSVSALEISAARLGPPLVMLSACSSARAADAELAGSLAAGFLAAGSDQVVATLRPVSDAGARRLTTRFYSAGGMTDPVRALARIQAELADTGDTDWPRFAVFGHDTCSDPY